MGSDTTDWPLLGLGEQPTLVQRAARPAARRARGRAPWLLAALAFLCGGLVSAAVFTIGWRHQAQRNTAAETALAAATARNHQLSAALAAARQAEQRDSRDIAHAQAFAAHEKALAQASAKQLAQAAASIAADASAANSAAGSVSSDASGVTNTAAKVANELKNLTTYLTTTPPKQIDSGYVASQTAYITRQLGKLQTSGLSVSSAVASFQAAAQKLARLAASLAAQN